jgi:hypothetical protein
LLTSIVVFTGELLLVFVDESVTPPGPVVLVAVLVKFVVAVVVDVVPVVDSTDF